MKLIFGIEFLGTSNMNIDFHSSIPIIIITIELFPPSKKKQEYKREILPSIFSKAAKTIKVLCRTCAM